MKEELIDMIQGTNDERLIRFVYLLVRQYIGNSPDQGEQAAGKGKA